MPERLSVDSLPDAIHGGDIDRVALEHGVSVDRLIDFSASINPAGPPENVLARLAREATDCSLLTRYPDPGHNELRSVLAATQKVPADCVTIANGTAALAAAIVRAIVPNECLLAVPVFGEYPRALDAIGCHTRFFTLDAADGFTLDVDAFTKIIEQHRPPLCVLTNPHNPSGVLTTKSQMLRVLDCARRVNTLLMVDEAFIDYTPDETLSAKATLSEHLVVLRSVTKFYAMPALRVGYAVSSPDLTVRIAAQLPPWPVTTLASGAAAEAVQDHAYAQRSLAFMADERRWLRQELETTGAEVYSSAANFLLLRLPATSPTSARLRARLIADYGVIVRDCRSFHGLSDGRFIRVAVRSREDNARLVRALTSVLDGALDAR